MFGNTSGIEEPSIGAQFAYIIDVLERRAKSGNLLAYIHVVEPRVSNLREWSLMHRMTLSSSFGRELSLVRVTRVIILSWPNNIVNWV